MFWRSVDCLVVGKGKEKGKGGDGTSDVELKDRKPRRVHVKVFEELRSGLVDVLAGGCDDGQIGGVEETAGELEADASGCWGGEEPWLQSHCCGT